MKCKVSSNILSVCVHNDKLVIYTGACSNEGKYQDENDLPVKDIYFNKDCISGLHR